LLLGFDSGMFDPVAACDFFISYTSADRAWAEWIAWELEAAGYTTLIQAWDFRPGMNFVTEMQKGAAESSRILIVLSEQFLKSGFTQAEWTAAFAKDPTGEIGLLIPVRVAECEPPGLLRARIHIDLVGLADAVARQVLLDGVKQGRTKPTKAPAFPGSARQRPLFPPAALRTIHNLPFPPNPVFTGRDADMERLGKLLEKHGEVEVGQIVVLHGLGGVGKTQLAVEYAWKHLSDYHAAFWVKADSPAALDASLASLAPVLGLPEASEHEQAVQTKSVLDWLNNHERWLLIADNADTDAPTKAVLERLSRSLTGHVLITSRISDWPVNIQDLALDHLSSDDATRYLLDRVARKRHNAGGDPAARALAQELGHLPLALEQAGSFIVEVRWSFTKYQEQFRKARLEILSERRQGATDYPESVAKTWSVTLEQLGRLARVLLRMAAWFGPDAIPRGIFSADKEVLSGDLTQQATVSNFAIEKALGELNRFSLIRLTSETVSVHRLLQAVEQDSLSGEECQRWLICAARLFNAFAPLSPDDVGTWGVWLLLAPHAEALLEHAKRHASDALPIVLMANQFGVFLHARAAYAQAETVFRRALAICEKVLDPEDPDVAMSLNNLAALYNNQGQYGKAEPLLQRALATVEKALGPEDPDVAISLNNLAELYRSQGQYRKAEPLYHRALTIDEKALGLEHPGVARSLNNLALLYDNQGQYGKAEPLYQRALAIREKTLGPEHPDVATSLNGLAWVYYTKGQYEKAEPLYQRALAIDEKALGPEHPDVARSLNNLAALYDNQRQYRKAEPLYQRALAIREKALDPEHPDVATSLNNVAVLYVHQGRYAEAEPLYQRALAISEKALGPEHPDVATCLQNYASLLRSMDRPDEAGQLQSRAKAIRAKRA
jgi:tetratricopeptide (TPR) repeat protein